MSRSARSTKFGSSDIFDAMILLRIMVRTAKDILFYESGCAALQAAAPPIGGFAAYLCVSQISALSLCIFFVVRTTGTDFYALLYCTVLHVLLLLSMMTFILADFCIFIALYYLYSVCCMLNLFA